MRRCLITQGSDAFFAGSRNNFLGLLTCSFYVGNWKYQGIQGVKSHITQILLKDVTDSGK